MMIAQFAQDDTTTSGLRLFAGRMDNRQVEIRRIGGLVNQWLLAQEKPIPDEEAARKFERKLHGAIKASSLYGSILSFAGLNLWVDERTTEGTVEIQESINL